MHDNNKQHSSDREEAEKGWQTPGIVLRKARRERGLSEEQVCQVLGLGCSALKALEADDFARLPAAIYVRGYIRSYCALLEIPEQPVLACYQQYNQELVDNSADVAVEPPVATLPVWKKPLFWVVVAVVITALVLLLLRGTSTDAGASQQGARAVSIQPGLELLQLRFEAITWVEVIDSRDDILLAEIKQAGDSSACRVCRRSGCGSGMPQR